MDTTLSAKFASSSPANSVTRFKAAGIHFAISLLVAAAVLLLMITIWYPSPYFQGVGGDELLMLIVGVDVVLGPLITLIIFDLKKKSLKWDLLVVAIVQIAALCYGVYAMYQGRPVYSVLVKDKFIVVTANEIEVEQLAKVKQPDFQALPNFGPEFVVAVEPTDEKERSYVETGAAFGMGLQFFPQYYRKLSQAKSIALAAAKPIATIRDRKPSSLEQIDLTLRKINKDPNSVVFIPWKAKKTNMVALLDASTGDILSIQAEPATK